MNAEQMREAAAYKAEEFAHDAQKRHWRDGAKQADRIAAAIRAIPITQEPVRIEWQPMQTAPRGGEWFFAREAGGRIRYVHFADDRDRFPISDHRTIWTTEPVEWTPAKPVFAALDASPAPDPVVNAGSCQQITVEQAAKVPEIAALIEAAQDAEYDLLQWLDCATELTAAGFNMDGTAPTVAKLTAALRQIGGAE